jgi:ribonuclease HII
MPPKKKPLHENKALAGDPAVRIGLGTSGEPHEPGAPFGPELELWQSGVRHVIGVDEAGRGPLAGPVVAAAVLFEPDVRLEGVTDSKMLIEEAREELYGQIIDKAAAWAVAERDHLRIDEINILQATREAMDEAARAVAGRVGAEWPTLLVDGIIPQLSGGRHINLPKGDMLSFSIGAASILAKVHRDRLMVEQNRLYPGYGFDHNRGYYTAKHIDRLLELGACEIHRKTFSLGSRPGDPVKVPISRLRPGMTRRDLAHMIAGMKAAVTRKKNRRLREEALRLRGQAASTSAEEYRTIHVAMPEAVSGPVTPLTPPGSADE